MVSERPKKSEHRGATRNFKPVDMVEFTEQKSINLTDEEERPSSPQTVERNERNNKHEVPKQNNLKSFEQLLPFPKLHKGTNGQKVVHLGDPG